MKRTFAPPRRDKPAGSAGNANIVGKRPPTK